MGGECTILEGGTGGKDLGFKKDEFLEIFSNGVND